MSDRRLVIGFTGPSGVGKTTLLERVVATLAGQDLRVGVVKRASHHGETDRPGKDSFRLYQAGSAAVALASPDQITTFVRHEASPPRLQEVLDALPGDLDVILVEGYLSEPLPRYVLLPCTEDAGRPYLESGKVLGTIHPPPSRDGCPPPYPAELVQEIAGEILAKLREQQPQADDS